MGRNVRIGLVVLGAAMTVYATASLTGGWLGTPPWWTRSVPPAEAFIRRLDGETIARNATRLREGRESLSCGVVVAGLALAAFAARWPRRADSTTESDGLPTRSPS